MVLKTDFFSHVFFGKDLLSFIVFRSRTLFAFQVFLGRFQRSTLGRFKRLDFWSEMCWDSRIDQQKRPFRWDLYVSRVFVALKNPWETQKNGGFCVHLEWSNKNLLWMQICFFAIPTSFWCVLICRISVRIIFTTFNQSTCCSSVTSTSARMNMFLDMILTHGIHVWYIYLYLP